MKYQGILLDLDHTLYDYDSAHAKAMQQAAVFLEQVTGKNKTELIQHYDRIKQQLETQLMHTAASHNRLLRFQRLLEELQFPPCPQALRAYNTYWDTLLDHAQLRPGVLEFLQFITTKKRPICLVTDLTAHIQHRKVEKLQLSAFIQYIVSSEEAGVEKPHARIFEIALAKLKLKPHEVCMIGDNWQKDILGALQLNMDAYYLETQPPASPTGINTLTHPKAQNFTSFHALKELLCHT